MTDAKTSQSSTQESSRIKHIVISGGGGTGFAFYGALRESNKAGFWNMADIETMHSTSIGTCLMMSLPIIQIIGWDAYDDFLIKRPWDQLIEINADTIFKFYSNIGLFDREVIERSMQPLLASVDLSLNTTLQEFYEFSGVEMHWYTTNLDEYRLEDVSYKTHPNWTVVDATYCSAALPLLCRPGNVNGVSYADGGFFCSYPISKCADLVENTDEIFGICKNFDNKPRGYTKRTEYENIVDYLSDLVIKTTDGLGPKETPEIKHFVRIQDENSSISQVINAFKTPESRSLRINKGVEAWKEFYARLRHDH